MCATARPAWNDAADLHFHLLPGVDDGPEELADSIELAAAAVADGTRTVVATPHVRSDFVTDVMGLRERMRELCLALDREGIPLRVRNGGELGHELIARLSQAELESLAQGPRGARWLLLEAPWSGFGPDFHEAATELRRRGFGVLIAHPERSADAELDGSEGLRRELAAGSLAQVNAQSLTGEHGAAAEAAAYALIGEGLVAIVASDAHGPSRPPSLAAAYLRVVARGVDAQVARVLTYHAPRRLLAGGMRRPDALAA